MRANPGRCHSRWRRERLWVGLVRASSAVRSGSPHRSGGEPPLSWLFPAGRRGLCRVRSGKLPPHCGLARPRWRFAAPGAGNFPRTSGSGHDIGGLPPGGAPAGTARPLERGARAGTGGAPAGTGRARWNGGRPLERGAPAGTGARPLESATSPAAAPPPLCEVASRLLYPPRCTASRLASFDPPASPAVESRARMPSRTHTDGAGQ